MDENYNDVETFVEENPMTVSPEMKNDLRSSARWAKFLTIVMAVATALVALLGIFMMAFSRYVFRDIPAQSGMGTFLGLTYLVVTALVLYPIIQGLTFSRCVKNACRYNSEEALARGFRAMHAWFHYNGILTIVSLVLYVIILLALILAMVFGVFSNP
ncbi:MAG: hypothetical protein K5945_07380 [Bacteroidaceae bacterium]|nr:hypothetical protein [Bacteroidaceae bacterium]